MRVLLLHAWPFSERMWASQVDALRDAGFQVDTPHLYGLGPSIDDWAAKLLRDYDGPLAVVGASMGGYCALALARRAPERIVGMVLVGTRATADSFQRRRERDEQIGLLRSGRLPQDADPEVEGEDLAVAQEAIRDRLDLSGVVASFGGPILVCAGEEDEAVPMSESLELAESAIDGRLEPFPGAGLFVNLDEPGRFNALLLDFLSRWRT